MDTTQTNLLMKLPREIRDTIYRYLLSTTYTFVEDEPGPRVVVTDDYPLHGENPLQRYNFHPEILRVNRQIGAEAGEMLYEENGLIVIELDAYLSSYTLETSLPQLTGVAPYKVKPSLTVTLKGHSGSEEPEEYETGTILVTGRECLGTLVECLWQMLFCFHGQLGLTLAVNPKDPRRHKELLEPFQQVQRLRDFAITGTTDQSLVGPLRKAISSTPPPESVKALIDHLSSSCLKAYRQQRYNLARIFGCRLGKYESYIQEIMPRWYDLGPLDEPLCNAYNSTYAHRVQAGWKSALACLHLEDYRTASKMASQARSEDSLQYRDIWTYHTSTYQQDVVLQAKMDVCSAMARFALNDRNGKWDLISAVKTLRRDGRHVETVQKLLDEHDAAKHEFPEIWLQNPTRAAETKKGFFSSACRSYWDFLEPKEPNESEEIFEGQGYWYTT
ncbi:hypothetical protein MMC30_004548 [Trapelia coarctata]|nr:hypothetical protein [Trapelia coarctata]